MKVLLIIPAYNEEESIINTLKKIDSFKEQATSNGYQLDYLVVNDGSRDNTEPLLQENHANHVSLVMNLGIGGAVQTGYLYAKEHDYDIAVQFDGDGQHDIESLPNLLAPIIAGEADFTIGSRFVDGNTSEFKSSTMRRVGIKLLSFMIRLFAGKKIYDVTSGYRAANRKAYGYFVERYPISYPEPESIVYLIKKHVRMKECPVNMFEREGGNSSIHSFKSVVYMLEVATAIMATSFMKKGD